MLRFGNEMIAPDSAWSPFHAATRNSGSHRRHLLAVVGCQRASDLGRVAIGTYATGKSRPHRGIASREQFAVSSDRGNNVRGNKVDDFADMCCSDRYQWSMRDNIIDSLRIALNYRRVEDYFATNTWFRRRLGRYWRGWGCRVGTRTKAEA